ncbi:enzymatic polyprotein endonuclease reverse [Lasius niger]|uniref:Enzymatic polyprotein endonuclease reverse n=1 Tax=Lasius niger TaxID=67767 RepID=A0A0J7JW53_LASNI|nr:enzymatic polyprotein endonuclease reverse [Lasius niger]
MTAPVLKYPDFNEEFKVNTDASDYAIGAVLSQKPVGNNRPIAYASRVLSRAEQNYKTTEKELLAIVWAVKHFRPYVYGTKFKIISDHKPLIWLFNVNDPGSRLIRWRLKLEEYDYEIIHKAG